MSSLCFLSFLWPSPCMSAIHRALSMPICHPSSSSLCPTLHPSMLLFYMHVHGMIDILTSIILVHCLLKRRDRFGLWPLSFSLTDAMAPSPPPGNSIMSAGIKILPINRYISPSSCQHATSKEDVGIKYMKRDSHALHSNLLLFLPFLVNHAVSLLLHSISFRHEDLNRRRKETYHHFRFMYLSIASSYDVSCASFIWPWEHPGAWM